uniref:Insulin-degrading enzyme n=1 Tax=Romanomermis culicivorax TaxID=13658 RepID=A0A915IFI3_ROMCU
VLPRFNQIKNKSLPSLYWPEHAYGPEQVGKRVNVVPVKDLRKLYLYFPTPDFLPHYNSKPEHYVSHLLGHEGSGSLVFELKRRGWLVNDLVAAGQPLACGFASFSIEMELTEEGLKNLDEIIALFFEYLHVTLKNIQPQEWIHREVEKLNNIHFRFAENPNEGSLNGHNFLIDKKNPDEYVSSLSPSLHYYSLKDVLVAPVTSMPDFKPQLIKDLVSLLNPKNLLVIVASKEYEGTLI